MTGRRTRLQRAATAARWGGRVARGGGRVVRVASRTTRSSTSWTMGRVLGPHAYRRGVDDLVGRLSDALGELEGVIAAQRVEIERLRRENTELRGSRR